MIDRPKMSADEMIQTLKEARARTLELVSDLSDEQIIGPQLDIVNPLLWEIGHVAWFQENWVLRHLGKQPPLIEGGDTLYDSAAVPHDTRWELWLPSREKTLEYMGTVMDRVIARLGATDFGEAERYFPLLAAFHEYMHSEALTYTRQTLGYPAPRLGIASATINITDAGALPGDAEIPGGTFLLGATQDFDFVFDNEKWAHPVQVQPFRIARAPVTNVEFAGFVNDGGYLKRRWWSEDGWTWRERSRAEHPVYWQRESDDRWLRRKFDQIAPLEDHLPIMHVNWFEAEAYCRWANRRLPTEAEWEMAASSEPMPNGRGVAGRKRRYPWGDHPPTPERANLDWSAMGCLPVAALPAGDSAFGCRQMIGNVWEWTADTFVPYPGFVVDPYKEYSEPWFGTHKVLRGGCWTTRSLLIRNTWRNFYTPDRRDVWAGFRTCAI